MDGPGRHRPDVEGLRALAVTLVVAAHLTGVPRGGFVGVDVFFVISGFLITTLLGREHAATGRISLRGFYVRRARRLLPAGALVVVVTVLAARLLGPVRALCAGSLAVSVLRTADAPAAAYFDTACRGFELAAGAVLALPPARRTLPPYAVLVSPAAPGVGPWPVLPFVISVACRTCSTSGTGRCWSSARRCSASSGSPRPRWPCCCWRSR